MSRRSSLRRTDPDSMIEDLIERLKEMNIQKKFLDCINNFVEERKAASDQSEAASDQSEADSDQSKADSDSDQSEADSDQSDSAHDEIVDNNANLSTILNVHEPMVYESIHCPPLDSVPMLGECNCTEFGLHPCLQESWVNGNAPREELNFDTLRITAINSANDNLRFPNNEQRKRLYKSVFCSLPFSYYEQGSRKELPQCAYGKIRQIYPNANGNYMGFLES